MKIWIRYINIWIYEYIYNSGVSSISGESIISGVLSISLVSHECYLNIYKYGYMDMFIYTYAYEGLSELSINHFNGTQLACEILDC